MGAVAKHFQSVALAAGAQMLGVAGGAARPKPVSAAAAASAAGSALSPWLFCLRHESELWHLNPR